MFKKKFSFPLGIMLKPGVGNRPVITYAYLSQVDQIA